VRDTTIALEGRLLTIALEGLCQNLLLMWLATVTKLIRYVSSAKERENSKFFINLHVANNKPAKTHVPLLLFFNERLLRTQLRKTTSNLLY
jgi:hypothetical protein